MTITLHVPDMSCAHCKSSVERAVGTVDPKAQVAVDMDARRVTVITESSEGDLIQALDAAGFPACATRD